LSQIQAVQLHSVTIYTDVSLNSRATHARLL